MVFLAALEPSPLFKVERKKLVQQDKKPGLPASSEEKEKDGGQMDDAKDLAAKLTKLTQLFQGQGPAGNNVSVKLPKQASVFGSTHLRDFLWFDAPDLPLQFA